MELPKTYQPADVEKKWYRFWTDGGYFKADANSSKPKYSIVIPPPNVTGVLHMGHMLNNTIQDVLIRRARMKGFEACWVPGTDHASIATEAKVVAFLKEQGLDKKSVGREKFLEHAFEWKEKYGGIILDQLRKLGCSCDWDRTRFTMEKDLSEAVSEAFIHLYKQGLIYRGERMVNWDPQGKTALSDEELITKETTLRLYHIRYAIEGEKDSFITVATSRPETIMADAAICVHPEDERYLHLHGKSVEIPLIGRTIPVIADEYVSMEFGTGCLKVTPAHDKNDFELGQKHGLPVIDILNEDGTLNEKALIYTGEDRFIARKKIARQLEEEGFLVKTEDYASQVSTSERTGAVVEPRISMQWFVDMKKFMDRNPEVLDAVMNDEIGLVPSKFKSTYRHWIENIKDWCISRQLWWGQRIPAWYSSNGDFAVAATAEEAAEEFNKKGFSVKAEDLLQDEDVVDTWFSSWLWPISVFDGFKNPDNPDIKAFYPTSTLVTGPDIIFFWVARMVMAGYEFRDSKPFEKVYFTGIVRDKLGRKMSKSLGNSPDAIELMDKYGTDGVRMGILLAAPAGNDLLFDEAKVEQGRNFCNKIWNAFRLIQGWQVIPDKDTDPETMENNRKAGEWFDRKLESLLAGIEDKYEDFRLSEVLMQLYKLVWDDFCSWYLEMIKPAFGEGISASARRFAEERLGVLLKLLHPFMPFITEEIYAALHQGPDYTPLIVSAYPVSSGLPDLENEDSFVELISQVRNYKNSKGLSPRASVNIALQCSGEASRDHYIYWKGIIEKLTHAGTFDFTGEKPANAAQVMIGKDALYFYTDEKVDVAAEKEKISKELEYLDGFLRSIRSKLGNERFIANARPELIKKERQKEADTVSKINMLRESLEAYNV